MEVERIIPTIEIPKEMEDEFNKIVKAKKLFTMQIERKFIPIEHRWIWRLKGIWSVKEVL